MTNTTVTAQPLWPAVLVVLAGIVAAMHVGKVAPAIPILRAQLDVSLVQAGWLLSLSQMAGMLTAVFVGMFADGFGLRRSVLWGLVLLGLLSGLAGLTTSAPQLLLMRAIEGAAILMVIVPAPALLRSLVDPDRLSTAMGFWGTFMPTGTATALLLGPALMAHFGWATWWETLGAIALLMALLFNMGVPRVAVAVAGARPPPRTCSGYDWSGVRRRSGAWLWHLPAIAVSGWSLLVSCPPYCKPAACRPASRAPSPLSPVQ